MDRARTWRRVVWIFSGLAVLLAGVRVWTQGVRAEGPYALYTDSERQFYMSDPVLGWKEAEGSWFWLGLELTALTLCVAVALWVMLWLAVRWQTSGRGWQKRAVPAMGYGALVVALLLPVLPAWSWLSGLPPEGSLLTIPSGLESLKGSRAGSFEKGKAGVYEVLPEHSRVVAKVSAGGETFDVTFAAPTGELRFDPTRLREDAQARIVVRPAGLDAGGSMRTTSVREDYLNAAEFPEITLEFLSVEDSRIDESGDKAEVDVQVRLTLMGVAREHNVTALLTAVRDEETKQTLGLDGAEGFVLRSQMDWLIAGSPLEAKQSAFESNTIPVITRLVLRFDQLREK